MTIPEKRDLLRTMDKTDVGEGIDELGWPVDHAAAYRAAAPHLTWQLDHSMHVHHLAVVRAHDRDAFRSHLESHGVRTAVHYPLALTQQPAYTHFTTAPCPHAEAWAAGCVSVPCFPELTDDEVAAVCAALQGASA